MNNPSVRANEYKKICIHFDKTRIINRHFVNKNTNKITPNIIFILLFFFYKFKSIFVFALSLILHADVFVHSRVDYSSLSENFNYYIGR